jgi:hypothetical protein
LGAQSATLPVLAARVGVSESRGAPKPADGDRFGERIRLGVLTRWITSEIVDEVLEQTGRVELRRRLLPARAVMYFVLGLCLFSSAESTGQPGYRAVLRGLTNKLRHLPDFTFQQLPTSSALTRARQRLGDKPLHALFERLSGPLASSSTVSAFAFGLRLVAWDGTVLDVPDTPANAAEFGFTGKNGVNLSGNPQVRLMALVECGTHALIDAAFDAVARFSEHALARRLLASLDASMLLLADRNFAGYELWAAARATGAHLVWRLKQNTVFDPLEVLPDGSFLAIMRTPADNIRYGQARAAGRTLKATPQGHLVRIINYTVTVRATDGPAQTETFRLVTSLLNHNQAPARQLAMIYHRRWEIENSYAEMKNRLRGAGFILRSKLPELVCQEVYALLTVYQALCSLEVQAAEQAGIDPERVSFTVTVQLVRLSTTDQAAADTATLSTASRQVTEDLLDALLPPRRDRRCERVKKPSKNTFETKKRDRPRTDSNVSYRLAVARHPPLPATMS